MCMSWNVPWSKNIGWRVQTRRRTTTWQVKSSWNRRAKECSPGLWETRPGGLLTRRRAEDWGEGFGGAARDNGRHRRRPTRGMIRDKTALRATRWPKAIKTHRAMSHPVKHVTSGGGAAYLLSMA